jgi:signal transduction histidine kinase
VHLAGQLLRQGAANADDNEHPGLEVLTKLQRLQTGFSALWDSWRLLAHAQRVPNAWRQGWSAALASQVRCSGETLLTLITDILDFSRIEANKLVISNAEFQLQTVIEAAMEITGLRAAQKRLQVRRGRCA